MPTRELPAIRPYPGSEEKHKVLGNAVIDHLESAVYRDCRRRPLPPGGGAAPGSGEMEKCLWSRLGITDSRFSNRSESCATEKFLIVSRTDTRGGETQWLVGAATRRDRPHRDSPAVLR